MEETVIVECYHCGGSFEMDKELYIRAFSIGCPLCESTMAKEPNEFCKELLACEQ